MSVSLTVVDQTVAEPNYLFDTVWDGWVGDWAPASPSESANTGGLRARSPLHTAILLCLMSDRRAESNDFIPDGSGDPRGWAGDAIDTAAAPLGSRLWQLRRRELTPQIASLAEVFAREALQTLIDQGACASVSASAVPNLAVGRMELSVALYRQDGSLTTSMNFWLLWTSNGIHNPLAP
jgi:phage gp46-like protein